MEITVIIRGASSLDEIRKAFENPSRVTVTRAEMEAAAKENAQMVFPWYEEDNDVPPEPEQAEPVKKNHPGPRRSTEYVSANHILKDHGYTQRHSSKMARTLGVANIGTDNNPKYLPKDAAAIVEALDKLQKKD